MAYADQQGLSGNRLIAIIIVALIHIGIGYALVTGLAQSAVKKAIERVTTVDIEEPEEPEEEPPPPEPDTPPPPPIVAPPPPINIAVAPPPIQTVTTPPPPAPVIRIAPPVAAPPPPAPSQARGLRPKNQSSWAGRIQSNYPARALREGTEGTVGVSVTVGADGRVSACSVTSSSGSSALDEAACQGMQRYARYDPALNDAGQPISASTSTRIVYKLD
jgi:periplasmic protein TonB